jgi:hypothetical protein
MRVWLAGQSHCCNLLYAHHCLCTVYQFNFQTGLLFVQLIADLSPHASFIYYCIFFLSELESTYQLIGTKYSVATNSVIVCLWNT